MYTIYRFELPETLSLRKDQTIFTKEMQNFQLDEMRSRDNTDVANFAAVVSGD